MLLLLFFRFFKLNHIDRQLKKTLLKQHVCYDLPAEGKDPLHVWALLEKHIKLQKQLVKTASETQSAS